MAVLTKAALKGDIDAFIKANFNNEITGPVLNQRLTNFIDSLIHRVDDKKLLGLRPYDPTRVYEEGETCVAFGNVYLAMTDILAGTTPEATDPSPWLVLNGATAAFLNNFDPWENSTIYNIGDTFRYLSKLYEVVDGPVQGVVPPHVDYYEEVSPDSMAGGAVGSIFTYRREVSVDEIANMNTSPIILVKSPGPGFAIVPLSAQWKSIYVTSEWAGNPNTSLAVYTNPANPSWQILAGLNSGAAATAYMEAYHASGFSGGPSIIEDEHLYLTVPGGNPAGGDSPGIIYGTYKIIEG